MWRIENVTEEPVRVGDLMIGAGRVMLINTRDLDRPDFWQFLDLVASSSIRMSRIISTEEMSVTNEPATANVARNWRRMDIATSGPSLDHRVQELEETVAALQETIETLAGMDALAVQELLREIRRRG